MGNCLSRMGLDGKGSLKIPRNTCLSSYGEAETVQTIMSLFYYIHLLNHEQQQKTLMLQSFFCLFLVF